MPQFAVVLGGGAARGAAHIGVLRALAEADLQPDLVVGVSVGAIVGAAYCREVDPQKAVARLSLLAQRLQGEMAGLPPFKRFQRALQILSYRNRRAVLEKDLALRGLSFSHLCTPFLVTATRLLPFGREVLGTSQEKSVVEAVLASSALPSHLPIRADGRLYLDGGLTGNLPTLVAARAGAKIILAVNLGFIFKRRDLLFPWTWMDRLWEVQMRREMEVSRRMGAFVVELFSPEVEAESVLAFERLDKLEELGYKACLNLVPALTGAIERNRQPHP